MSGAQSDWSARRPLIWGFLTVGLLVGGFGVWTVVTILAGAIIAPGQIEVARNRQVVQHLDGGVVAEIVISEGETVAAGDILVRLDGSLLWSELAIVENQLFELLARRARLEAERDDLAEVRFPDELVTAGLARPEVVELTEGQSQLFLRHRETLAQALDQRRTRIGQIASKIEGIEAQAEAIAAQTALLQDEVADQRGLLEKGLTQATRVSALDRELAQMKGRAGELTAARAESADRITEIEIEMLGLGSRLREAAETELRDVAARELELAERRRALAERIARLDIRAPVAGIVLGLVVTTPQSVIRPADPVLYIVPQDRPLVITARVPVMHVDELRVGQEVRLVFSALPSRTTPELIGHVTLVSADALVDDRTGVPYYRTEIGIDPDELRRIDRAVLVPGMPVDAFIRTEDRTPLSYLLKPFTDYFNRAFRET